MAGGNEAWAEFIRRRTVDADLAGPTAAGRPFRADVCTPDKNNGCHRSTVQRSTGEPASSRFCAMSHAPRVQFERSKRGGDLTLGRVEVRARCCAFGSRGG